jgi:pimeloyl-ACP methyl ester carboxylesterase
VLDLRPGASLVEALVSAGFDVWCLGWGTPEAEDRYLDWEAVLARLGRAVRRVRRETGADQIGVLGYCMGGTLTSIYVSQHASEIAALVTLAAPIEDRQFFVCDPMLATGGSAVETINRLKALKIRKIIFVCLVAAPEGMAKLSKAHPDVPIFAASLDRQLNDQGYILPGLGDAGDRLFGTK